MTIEVRLLSEPEVTCSSCEACCCRLPVMLITDTGVPERYIETSFSGGDTMARLDDGWCAALDRNSMRCRIYQNRPLICREFEMGDYECVAERTAYFATSD
ncbi:MAG: YkgJ family cysteine cluster protein [Motiliproteus sp.]